ncbi:hypothetical protein B5X24_HaOG203567 [Helicoverpa armigera]|uniref:Abnormal spindle-like microcephaly-associated protein ASH domain-containing protein n=1 Tax=Helicoverpa armigera TaxID=29058 RepID=A0A2W1BWR5_HELAM|nr:hypothetical protein B5X24_HaOG203567 [Helicoverpa armigera]
MEILQKFKQNGYFTAELYHLLSKKKLCPDSTEITPSEYEKEMKMSTQQRLQTLNNIEMDNIISIAGKHPNKTVLLFSPKLLVFQNFKPNDKIVAKFSVKNISQGPTCLNMVFKESSYFFIKPYGGQLLSRLAPGISVTFAITFLPVQYEDYTHRVTFYTDHDQYVLPLIVQPKSAYLSKDQKIDINVAFKTMHLGDTNGMLSAIFETGENFSIMLSGSTHTVSVELEKQVVRFFDTYNTMMRQQSFKIINKSDHLLTYMFMKNDNVYYDFEEKVKLATIFYNMKESESAKYMKLVQYDVLSSDEHERVYTRIFYDEIQSLVADETLRYQNTHFSIEPIVSNYDHQKIMHTVISLDV